MDRERIYNLLCEVIKEAELGKKECVRDDFEEWRLCNHAWENIENLIEEIRETITAEHRASIEHSRIQAFSKEIYLKNRSVKDFTECNMSSGKAVYVMLISLLRTGPVLASFDSWIAISPQSRALIRCLKRL